MPSVVNALDRNFKFSQTENFENYIVSAIAALNIRLLRVHVSGDFYSQVYARKWLRIMKRCRTTTFFMYTRSWRTRVGGESKLSKLLYSMSELHNVRMLLSCDMETGAPMGWPNTRRAYLQLNDTDIPQFPVDLVFRDKDKTVAKKIDDAIVCPYEQGLKTSRSITCEKCKLCFSRGRQVWQKQSSSTRTLPIISTPRIFVHV